MSVLYCTDLVVYCAPSLVMLVCTREDIMQCLMCMLHIVGAGYVYLSLLFSEEKIY